MVTVALGLVRLAAVVEELSVTRVESDRLGIRREYLDDFAAVLPGRTVARLYQIENKIDALIRYDLAREIPVVEGDAPPAN